MGARSLAQLDAPRSARNAHTVSRQIKLGVIESPAPKAGNPEYQGVCLDGRQSCRIRRSNPGGVAFWGTGHVTCAALYPCPRVRTGGSLREKLPELHSGAIVQAIWARSKISKRLLSPLQIR